MEKINDFLVQFRVRMDLVIPDCIAHVCKWIYYVSFMIVTKYGIGLYEHLEHFSSFRLLLIIYVTLFF